MPQISIIVPVYKVKDYLCQCIDSILEQTFCDFELILVDDGSPDNSGMICDEYSRKDSRVRVIHKENGGVSSARNAGIEAAQGEYIAFVDADDWLAEDFLEKAVTACREKELDLYMTGSIQFTAEDEQPSFVIGATYQGSTRDITGEQMCDLLEKSYGSSCWGKLIKRDCIGKLRFDTSMSFGEDLKFVLALLDQPVRFMALPEAGYYYRCTPDSATKSTNRQKIDNLTEVYRRMFSFGKERKYPQSYFEFVGDCWVGTRGYFRSLVAQSAVNVVKKQTMYLRMDTDPVIRGFLAQCQVERTRKLARHPLSRMLHSGCNKVKVFIYKLLKK